MIVSSSPTTPCPPHAGRWVLAATILGSSLAFIDGTVVNVALPALQAHLHATVVDVQWVVEAYALLLAALLLVGGSLGDIYGRKRIFLTGVLIFAAASAWCGFAADVAQLILARAVQGIGAALLVPGSLAIISASFAERDRGRAIGTWSGFTAITAAVGPVLGGWLIEHASWRWAFFINLPIAAVVVALTFWRVPESRRTQRDMRLDWLGALFATIGLGGTVYALIESSKKSWTDPSLIMAALVGISALVMFVVIERHSRAPLLPLNLFRVRNFIGANLLTLFLYSALSGFFFFFPLNLIQVHGYPATEAGAATLPFILLMFVFSRWSGGLVMRYGATRPLVLGPIVAAAGFALFALAPTGGSYWTGFFPPVLVLGLGMVVSVAPLTTTVMNSVGSEQAGVASGINNAVSRLAAVLAIAVFGVVMLNVFNKELTQRLTTFEVPVQIQQKLDDQRIRLAAIEIPSDIDPETSHKIERAIHEAFASGFRVIMLIACGLALGSAACAWLIIN